MRRELTWQAVVSAVLVSAVVAASYPYVLLKLGIGPNVSVVSAFLGSVLLMLLAPKSHGQNRLMNNIVQTAGTSAAMTAFMCVIAAAVDLAAANQTVTSKLNGIHHIDPWPMFWWLTCAGGIGVLFTVLFRRHFLEDPKMIFADGVAAAETIVVLDSPGREAKDKLATLGLAGLASAALDWLREIKEWLPDYYFEPSTLAANFKSFRVGVEWNLLSLGTGMLIGLNVGLSMLAGSLVVAGVGPYLIDSGIARDIVLNNIGQEYREECRELIDKPWKDLTPEQQKFVKAHGDKQAGYMQHNYFSVVLLWFMWPATGMMIASALTAVLLKWRSIVQSFRDLRSVEHANQREDVSLTTIVIGSVVLTVALAWVQNQNFGMSYTQTIVAVLCSLPLILVGIRVLGETNNGPISVMMNGLQAVFAVFWSGSVGHNLIAAGMAGTCNAQGQGTIQDYKTGQLVGSTPRVLTWVQLAAVPIGAAAVAIMYPLLLQRYRLGEDLTTPTGVKIANMAVLLSQGIDALPPGALLWTVVGSIVGVVITLAKHFLGMYWLPSPAGFGLGLILPGTLNVVIAIGATVSWVWERIAKPSFDRYMVTVASGFIAGEAILGGLIIPLWAGIEIYFK
jgi:OPT family oligopeptide transporter